MWPFEGKAAVFTCVKRESLFFVGFAVGTWSRRTCGVLVGQLADAVRQPTYRQKLEVYSDGNDDYAAVLPEHFNRDSLRYGQLIKHKVGRRLVKLEIRKIYGNPRPGAINTTWVECFNSVLRGRLSRLVRRSKDCAKKKPRLENALGFFRFYWNFLYARDGKTPAMLEGLSSRVWGWRTFLNARLTDIS